MQLFCLNFLPGTPMPPSKSPIIKQNKMIKQVLICLKPSGNSSGSYFSWGFFFVVLVFFEDCK